MRMGHLALENEPSFGSMCHLARIEPAIGGIIVEHLEGGIVDLLGIKLTAFRIHRSTFAASAAMPSPSVATIPIASHLRFCHQNESNTPPEIPAPDAAGRM